MKIEFKSILQPIDDYFKLYIDGIYEKDIISFSADNPTRIYGWKDYVIPLNIGDSVYKDGKILYQIKEPKEKSIYHRMMTMGKLSKLSKNTVNN